MYHDMRIVVLIEATIETFEIFLGIRATSQLISNFIGHAQLIVIMHRRLKKKNTSRRLLNTNKARLSCLTSHSLVT